MIEPGTSLAPAAVDPRPTDEHEARRLAALHRYDVLDTAAETAFDDLATLAAVICGTSMALVSLVDAHRQWFKSRRGLDVTETPRDMSFCARALTSSDVMVVPDARVDERFRDNPYVVGEPYIRFYAGAPLVTSDGYALGTLCVLDTEPRVLGVDQLAHLRRLAAQVVSQLELRRQSGILVEQAADRAFGEAELRLSERRFRSLFDRHPVGAGIIDDQGIWVEANPALADLLGMGREDVLGIAAVDFVHPDDLDRIRALAAPGDDTDVQHWDLRFLRASGETRWASCDAFPSPGPRGEDWTVVIARDITDHKREEDALLDSQRDLTAVAAVARSALSGQDPRPLVVNTVRSLSGASTASLVEPAGADHLVVTASSGIDCVGRRLPCDGSSMVARVFESGRSIFLPDAAAHPRVHAGYLAMDGTVSALWQPVTVGSDVLGIVVATWRHRLDVLSGRASRVIRLLADEAAISLHAAATRAELERRASTDPLTGLLNRRTFEATVQGLVDESAVTGEPLAVALLDMDHFKAYNDGFGHAAGDQLLRTFSDGARSALRAADVLARWGGEEFVLALPGCPPDMVEDILARVRASVPAGQSCSIGHTVCRPGDTLDAAIARADRALYDAKRRGRDRTARG